MVVELGDVTVEGMGVMAEGGRGCDWKMMSDNCTNV